MVFCIEIDRVLKYTQLLLMEDDVTYIGVLLLGTENEVAECEIFPDNSPNNSTRCRGKMIPFTY